jgi:Fic family protein
MIDFKIKELPLDKDVETKRVMKALVKAHQTLAELKGIVSSIPNESILLNTLGLQEAKDSSAIENIITTHDDLYKSGLNLEGLKSLEAKEVQNYISALKRGFSLMHKHKILTANHIIEIQGELEKNKAGFRKVSGTALKNGLTGEVVYTPPQDYDTIARLMSNLEMFINNDDLVDLDPIVKMAIIHFQFESIHPFYDGNGRTGRIINVLYLVMKGLLDIPVLNLSSYIIANKGEYYRLLQSVRDTDSWEDWVLYMIYGVEQTAKQTIELVKEIKVLMHEYKHEIRHKYKFYSQDLLNNLFKHPYTKIELLENDLSVSRVTAASYLNELAKDGLYYKRLEGGTLELPTCLRTGLWQRWGSHRCFQ